MTPAASAEVEVANRRLYEALEGADVDAMAAVWDDGDPEGLVCVHPGWPMLRGRGEVLRSFAAIMANSTYLQFFLTDVQVCGTGSEEGMTAVVTCTENILTGATLSAAGAEGGPVVATNVFQRRAGRWRLRVHHASPVLGEL